MEQKTCSTKELFQQQGQSKNLVFNMVSQHAQRSGLMIMYIY